ncbi:hypothetical protein TELCIR_04540 [Teladorsagia circumcincta]|uniref:Transmembrane protein 138 n=1 Tax=Teladorsagia circumcincta TaxID=45464 RepID=A0A2G9UTC3_TELCI|nr:hypothetical protein TELCIR_04540 [Teladorsagia circumcincta]
MGSKYPLLLGAQIGMLITDVAFNAASVLLFGNSIVLLMMYILQDTLILLSVIVLVITFSSTFVFQAGLIFLLFRRFASTIISAFVYLGVSITLHCVTLVLSSIMRCINEQHCYLSIQNTMAILNGFEARSARAIDDEDLIG